MQLDSKLSPVSYECHRHYKEMFMQSNNVNVWKLHCKGFTQVIICVVIQRRLPRGSPSRQVDKR